MLLYLEISQDSNKAGCFQTGRQYFSCDRWQQPHSSEYLACPPPHPHHARSARRVSRRIVVTKFNGASNHWRNKASCWLRCCCLLRSGTENPKVWGRGVCYCLQNQTLNARLTVTPSEATLNAALSPRQLSDLTHSSRYVSHIFHERLISTLVLSALTLQCPRRTIRRTRINFLFPYHFSFSRDFWPRQELGVLAKAEGTASDLITAPDLMLAHQKQWTKEWMYVPAQQKNFSQFPKGVSSFCWNTLK